MTRGRVGLIAEHLTVHHRRFIAALESDGWDCTVIAAAPAATLGERILAAAPRVLLAGPVPTIGADAIAADADIPVIVVSWGSDLLRDVEDDPGAAVRATQALAAAAAVLVDCRTVADRATALGADPERIVRFPWGVDLTRHPYREPRAAIEGPLRILSLRTLEPVYRVDVLVRAVAEVTDATLTLAGGGSRTSALLELAADLGISDRVHVRGRVEESDVPALLHDHDVNVSTSPFDGSSISLLQAMACGCPSIVVDNASNREWIDEGRTGWTFPEGDVAALAERLRRFTGSDRSMDRLGVARAARTTVEERADWTAGRRALLQLVARVAAAWS